MDNDSILRTHVEILAIGRAVDTLPRDLFMADLLDPTLKVPALKPSLVVLSSLFRVSNMHVLLVGGNNSPIDLFSFPQRQHDWVCAFIQLPVMSKFLVLVENYQELPICCGLDVMYWVGERKGAQKLPIVSIVNTDLLILCTSKDVPIIWCHCVTQDRFSVVLFLSNNSLWDIIVGNHVSIFGDCDHSALISHQTKFLDWLFVKLCTLKNDTAILERNNFDASLIVRSCYHGLAILR